MGYNITALALTAAGLLLLRGATTGMSSSLLVVVANVLRLRKTEQET